jgi:hypothetical protein
MIIHRIIRFVCLIGASTAPLLAASMCRFISRTAVKHVIPRSGSEHLSSLTQTWIVGAADGSFPLTLGALLVSAIIAALGLYFIFSKRLSPEAASSAFVLVCCVGYTAALVTVGSTMIALVMPFLPMATS